MIPTLNGNDTITAGAGDDKLYAYGGDDVVRADEGSDTVYAGAGNDIVYGGLCLFQCKFDGQRTKAFNQSSPECFRV